jgi:hypothetical protein
LLLALAFALGHLGVRPSAIPELSPNDPTSAELVERPALYDGNRVVFTGEAVGEAMVRGESAWIHLNDDAYYLANVEEGAALGGYNSGMPVWVPTELAEGITHFGDYRQTGDVVTVGGTFNAACAEHGGDMDMHATSLEIEHVGRWVADPVSGAKVAWATGLALLAGLAFLADRFWDDVASHLDRA